MCEQLPISVYTPFTAFKVQFINKGKAPRHIIPSTTPSIWSFDKNRAEQNRETS